MSKVTITITMNQQFAEKFLGFLRNLLAVNTDKEKPFHIDSVEAERDEEPEFVAIPKDMS